MSAVTSSTVAAMGKTNAPSTMAAVCTMPWSRMESSRSGSTKRPTLLPDSRVPTFISKRFLATSFRQYSTLSSMARILEKVNTRGESLTTCGTPRQFW